MKYQKILQIFYWGYYVKLKNKLASGMYGFTNYKIKIYFK